MPDNSTSRPASCEAALRLDPGNYIFRSCAFTFMEMGNAERAMDFLRLDAGSEWSNVNAIRVLWSEGKLAEARDTARRLVSDPEKEKFFIACADRPSSTPLPAEFDRDAREVEPELLHNPDPENRYLFAADMAFCAEKEIALRLLKTVVEGNYCAYEALQKDRLWAPLRSAPEYGQLLSTAKHCQDKFLAEKDQGTH